MKDDPDLEMLKDLYLLSIRMSKTLVYLVRDSQPCGQGQDSLLGHMLFTDSLSVLLAIDFSFMNIIEQFKSLSVRTSLHIDTKFFKPIHGPFLTCRIGSWDLVIY